MRNVVTSITITTAVPVHIELHANKWDVIMECRVHYEDSVALAFRIIVGIPQMVLKNLCFLLFWLSKVLAYPNLLGEKALMLLLWLSKVLFTK
jgi:hypothetical protein